MSQNQRAAGGGSAIPPVQLSRNGTLMTPERFLQLLDVIGYGPREFSEVLDRDTRRVRRWAKGEVKIPYNVAEWLTAFALFMQTQAGGFALVMRARANYLKEHPPPRADPVAGE